MSTGNGPISFCFCDDCSVFGFFGNLCISSPFMRILVTVFGPHFSKIGFFGRKGPSSDLKEEAPKKGSNKKDPFLKKSKRRRPLKEKEKTKIQDF